MQRHSGSDWALGEAPGCVRAVTLSTQEPDLRWGQFGELVSLRCIDHDTVHSCWSLSYEPSSGRGTHQRPPAIHASVASLLASFISRCAPIWPQHPCIVAHDGGVQPQSGATVRSRALVVATHAQRTMHDTARGSRAQGVSAGNCSMRAPVSNGKVLATAHALKAASSNPSRRLHVTGTPPDQLSSFRQMLSACAIAARTASMRALPPGATTHNEISLTVHQTPSARQQCSCHPQLIFDVARTRAVGPTC